MADWKNLDQMKAYAPLEAASKVDVKEVMSGENGAKRVKTYNIKMAAGLNYNYAAKAVDDEIIDENEINKKEIFTTSNKKKSNSFYFQSMQIHLVKINENSTLIIYKHIILDYIPYNALRSNSSNKQKILKKVKNIAFIGETKRSSKYRGVSKNGNQWQVLFMNHNKKSYYSRIPS